MERGKRETCDGAGRGAFNQDDVRMDGKFPPRVCWSVAFRVLNVRRSALVSHVVAVEEGWTVQVCKCVQEQEPEV